MNIVGGFCVTIIRTDDVVFILGPFLETGLGGLWVVVDRTYGAMRFCSNLGSGISAVSKKRLFGLFTN